jgi:hypothetical protein
MQQTQRIAQDAQLDGRIVWTAERFSELKRFGI